jgi:hypothetical protein
MLNSILTFEDWDGGAEEYQIGRTIHSFRNELEIKEQK